MRFRSPMGGIVGRVQDALANAAWVRRMRRVAMRWLPFAVLESDVRDVVYAHWVVPVAAVADRVPPGVAIVERDGRTILTVLTYRHGHFGPALAGRLRRLFPSPVQSNWRLYVRAIGGVAPSVPTVLFLANVFDRAIHALGTRLCSDVMVAHHAPGFVHGVNGDDWVSGAAGGGSAPDWQLAGRVGDRLTLPPAFAPFFADIGAAVRSLCLQDAAIAAAAGTAALAHARIDLPIDVATVRPLTVTRYRPGALLRTFGATEPPFCFLVPAVRFRALSEELLPPPVEDQAATSAPCASRASAIEPSGPACSPSAGATI